MFAETLLEAEVKGGGVYQGRTGIALVYYLMAKDSGDRQLAERGLRLLEWVSEHGVSGDNIDFANGLAGIGWVIEWLAQNEFIDQIDTDMVLGPIDNILYKAVSYVKDDNPTLASGTLGKIAYFAKRAARHHAGSHRFKVVGHLECLVLLLDDLADKIGPVLALTAADLDGYDGDEVGGISLIELGQMLSCVTALGVKVNSPTTGFVIFGLINIAEKILSHGRVNDDNYLSHTYLAICYMIAAKQMDHPFWEESAIGHINRLVLYSDEGVALGQDQLFRKLMVFCLLNVHLPHPAYVQIVERVSSALSVADLSGSVLNGRGALLTASLCIANPALVRNWHEVLFLV